MGTIRDHSTGEIVGTVALLMDHGGNRYWDARIEGGPCKRFYLVDVVDLYSAEHRAVTWIINSAEEAN